MKIILSAFLLISSLLYGVSIYDIQYTTDPGPDGTYPSTYEGQIVTTGGLVAGIDFNNGRFFITSSVGGEWQGIYVYDDEQNVVVGDSIVIEAEVYEYWGFTELSSVNSCDIISTGNALPAAMLTTISGAITEARESTRTGIGINDLTISHSYDEWGQWQVTDGTEECIISTGFTNFKEMNIPILEGYPISAVGGFVTYFWEEFQLNPVSLSSITSSPEDHIISISEQQIFSSEEFEIPINHTVFNDGQIQSYQFEMQYDPQVLEYTSFEIDGTLSGSGTVDIQQINNNTISVSYLGEVDFSYMETLLNLKFTGVESGNADLEFTEFLINNSSVEYFSVQDILLQMEIIPIGDTLTVIQKPILNVPKIISPNEELQIECIADPSVTNWNASLQHNDKIIDLNGLTANYSNELERWQLSVQIPTPQIYELYDLVVSGEGIEADTTKNAVQIIPEIKDEYSFVHITDSHLPTHYFYPDPLSLIDTTEVTDLREVIKDINLINPEFVLITGDLINEGEMEDFENRRVYSKAQQMLTEFEVPVYLVTGNHDVGGWESSPPPQGTARLNWWRFFGWDWLDDPPASEPCYTQNYSFNYGPIHFIGIDSYINYDSYLTQVFGDESFTDLQMQWLNDDLAQNSASEAFVLFYHFDFSDQIDLGNLGVDMALWGHIHSNSGSIYDYPYNLATESTCDENRAYRVIKVNDSQLTPYETVYAGWDGEELSADFTPSNNGIVDSVYCYIENSHDLNFSNSQLQFIMPAGAEEYQVYNGDLLQVDESGEFAVCYVTFEIPANENISVSVVADFNSSAEEQILKPEIKLTNYPNPFNPAAAGAGHSSTTIISFSVVQESSLVTLDIYNLKGQKVKEFQITNYELGINEVVWDGTDQNNRPQPSGIYFLKLKSRDKIITKRIMLLK